MPSLTERVARAIEPDCDWDGLQLKECDNLTLSERTKQEIRESIIRNRGKTLGKARAAIKALPLDEMVERGASAFVRFKYGQDAIPGADIKHLVRIVIDAALKEGE